MMKLASSLILALGCAVADNVNAEETLDLYVREKFDDASCSTCAATRAAASARPVASSPVSLSRITKDRERMEARTAAAASASPSSSERRLMRSMQLAVGLSQNGFEINSEKRCK